MDQVLDPGEAHEAPCDHLGVGILRDSLVVMLHSGTLEKILPCLRSGGRDQEGVGLLTRCAWVGDEPLYIAYHDREWGVPVHDDRLLYEFLVLEGAQAGLSWLTILKKREGYRRAFADFDPVVVAGFEPADIERSAGRPWDRAQPAESGVGHRECPPVPGGAGRIRQFRQHTFGDSSAVRPVQNRWQTIAEIPAKTAEAERLSADLKRRGFRFVGPTIMYAHMQATGMVNDHTIDCFRWRELTRVG